MIFGIPPVRLKCDVRLQRSCGQFEIDRAKTPIRELR